MSLKSVDEELSEGHRCSFLQRDRSKAEGDSYVVLAASFDVGGAFAGLGASS
jgi:hypothetical protein